MTTRSVDLCLERVDWTKLHRQKQALVRLLWNNPVDPAWGIVNLLDSLQDQAVRRGLVPEHEVFPDGVEKRDDQLATEPGAVQLPASCGEA